MICQVMPRVRSQQLKVEAAPEQLERGRLFAAWLREAMKRHAWNITQLSDHSKVSKQYLGVLLNDGINNATGKYQRPGELVIKKIADATGAEENAGRAASGYVPKPTGDGIGRDGTRDGHGPTLSPEAIVQQVARALLPGIPDGLEVDLTPTVHLPSRGWAYASPKHPADPATEPEPNQPFTVPLSWLPQGRAHACYYLTVWGWGMRNAAMYPGHRVIVDPMTTGAKDQDGIIAVIGGQTCVGRLCIYPEDGSAHLLNIPWDDGDVVDIEREQIVGMVRRFVPPSFAEE